MRENCLSIHLTANGTVSGSISSNDIVLVFSSPMSDGSLTRGGNSEADDASTFAIAVGEEFSAKIVPVAMTASFGEGGSS